jgi:hypothetical protein
VVRAHAHALPTPLCPGSSALFALPCVAAGVMVGAGDTVIDKDELSRVPVLSQPTREQFGIIRGSGWYRYKSAGGLEISVCTRESSDENL